MPLRILMHLFKMFAVAACSLKMYNISLKYFPHQYLVSLSSIMTLAVFNKKHRLVRPYMNLQALAQHQWLRNDIYPLHKNCHKYNIDILNWCHALLSAEISFWSR